MGWHLRCSVENPGARELTFFIVEDRKLTLHADAELLDILSLNGWVLGVEIIRALLSLILLQ